MCDDFNPRHIELEVQAVEARSRASTGEVLGELSLGIGAALGGFSIMALSTNLVLTTGAAAAGTMPAWPKAIEGSRRLIENVLKGKESLDKLSPATREKAAQYYEQIANFTRNRLAGEASAFNLERARYLREGGSVPPGSLPQFIERMKQGH